MTSRMTSLDLFEKFDGLNDLFIAEAEIPEAHKSAAVLPTPRQKGRFSQFMTSGWGVAIICALVAVSVMGGIIWAGNRPDGPGIRPPVGNQHTEDLTFEQETMETIDPPAAEIAAKAPRFGWEKSVKSVQTTAFYSLLTYNMLEMGEYHVTEISLATREDDTRTLMFRLINSETYEVMARYSWDVTEGKWGVMDYGGFFAVYCATENGNQTLMKVDAFWWRPELDPHSYEYMGKHIPTIEESTTYVWKSPNAKDTAEWSRFVREWFTECSTTYLCMDEALGDLDFYTEDNRYTDGWARMRLFWQDLYIIPNGEKNTGDLEIVTERAEPEPPVPAETTDNLDPSFGSDTLAPELPTDDLFVPVEPEVDENGMSLFGTVPHDWPKFSLTAEQIMNGAEKIEWPVGATVRRGAVYTDVWREGRNNMRCVMEMREFTDVEGQTTLYLLLRDPANGEVVATHELSVTQGQWGIMQFEMDVFVLYYTEKGNGDTVRLISETLVWSNMDLSSATEDGPITVKEFRNPQTRIFRNASSGVQNNRESQRWNQLLAQLHMDMRQPLVRMVADGLFGEFAFFGDDEIATSGWERFLKVRVADLTSDALNAFPNEGTQDTEPPVSMDAHPVFYVEYDEDFLLPVAEEAAMHIDENMLPIYRADEEKPAEEGCLRFIAIPEDELGYYGYRIERTAQAITIYAAGKTSAMEAFVTLAEAFSTGYEDGFFLIFEDKDFLPIGSSIEVRS